MQAQSRTRELLIALFLLGVLLLTPPLLIVFNQATRVFGVPTLYLYLFVVWAALIALVAFTIERRGAAEDLGEADTEAPGRESSPITGAASDA
jgi:predicted tellurium resistance membrane protein TerC